MLGSEALVRGLYIAELNNHRVTRWHDSKLEIVMGGFGRGSEAGDGRFFGFSGEKKHVLGLTKSPFRIFWVVFLSFWKEANPSRSIGWA